MTKGYCSIPGKPIKGCIRQDFCVEQQEVEDSMPLIGTVGHCNTVDECCVSVYGVA